MSGKIDAKIGFPTGDYVRQVVACSLFPRMRDRLFLVELEGQKFTRRRDRISREMELVELGIALYDYTGRRERPDCYRRQYCGSCSMAGCL